MVRFSITDGVFTTTATILMVGAAAMCVSFPAKCWRMVSNSGILKTQNLGSVGGFSEIAILENFAWGGVRIDLKVQNYCI